MKTSAKKSTLLLKFLKSRKRVVVTASLLVFGLAIVLVMAISMRPHKKESSTSGQAQKIEDTSSQTSGNNIKAKVPNSGSINIQSSDGNTPKPESAAQDKTYTSKENGYSFIYPESWQVDVSKDMRNNEWLSVQSKVKTGDNINMTIAISDIQDSTYQPKAVPYGTITVLANNLSSWEQNKDTSHRDSPTSMYCPTLHLVEGKDSQNYHFSHRLNNGKYLTVQGTFCINERYVPSYNYEEQLASKEWSDAKNIIGSLKFK